MLLCNGTAFVHINKTGGTSVRTAILRSGYPCTYVAKVHIPGGRLRTYENQYHPHFIPQESNIPLDRLWVFTFVRNPWKRFHSWYTWRKDSERRGRTFRQFMLSLKTNKGRTPIWQSMYFSDPEIYSFVGKLETIDHDWKLIAAKTGFKNSLTKENQSPPVSTPWRDDYDPELIDLVADKEQFIIDKFGYTFT